MPPQTEEKTTALWMKEAQKGYIRVGVLILLSKKPTHGYEIMKEIRNRTKGFWTPTAGGVYPILRDLEEAKYIEGQWSTQTKRRTKVYKITDTGRQILKSTLIKQSEIANNINQMFQEFATDVLKVQTHKLPTPIMPSPFTPFLEEKIEEDQESLTKRRKHLELSIEMLQKELNSLNKKQEKKSNKKSSSVKKQSKSAVN
jgi:DNA-binding PadR family transcriptional regulator